MSARQAAEACGVSQGAYSRYENGRTPAESALDGIAAFLGITRAEVVLARSATYVEQQPEPAHQPELTTIPTELLEEMRTGITRLYEEVVALREEVRSGGVELPPVPEPPKPRGSGGTGRSRRPPDGKPGNSRKGNPRK